MDGKNPSEEHLQGLQEVKSVLTMSARRWELAGKSSGPFNLQYKQALAKHYIYLGAYLKLIEAREAIYSSGLS
jgi:hypothetical protein